MRLSEGICYFDLLKCFKWISYKKNPSDQNFVVYRLMSMKDEERVGKNVAAEVFGV